MVLLSHYYTAATVSSESSEQRSLSVTDAPPGYATPILSDREVCICTYMRATAHMHAHTRAHTPTCTCAQKPTRAHTNISTAVAAVMPQASLAWINALPLDAPPCVFGLPASATMARDRQEAAQLLDDLLTTQAAAPLTAAHAAAQQGPAEPLAAAPTQEVLVGRVAADILARLPPDFDLEAAEAQHPQTYHDSINTVLHQARLLQTSV